MKTKLSLPLDKRAWRPSPLVGQIVLVTTRNEDGGSNIAPKSWVSMMSFEPPILAIGCNSAHWTARNILRAGEFVVNIPGDELAAAVWNAYLKEHPRPVEAVGLTPRSARLVAPPLVEECKAHLECRLEQQVRFGDEIVLFGRIVAASVDQEALAAEDPYEYLRLIVYLENKSFGVVGSARRVPDI